MGGFWSGKFTTRKRRGKKLLTSSIQSIDSFQAFKAYKQAPIGSTLKYDTARVEFKDNRVYFYIGDKSKYLDTAATPCHYGGFRYWFVCPSCRSNNRFLYFQGIRVACRRCLNLSYPSQNETLAKRIQRRKRKILGEYRYEGDWFNKPKWTRKKTWNTLRHVDDEYGDLAILSELYSVRSLKVLSKLREVIPCGWAEMERIAQQWLFK